MIIDLYLYTKNVKGKALSLFYLTKYYFFPIGHSYLATYIPMQLLKGDESEVLKFIASLTSPLPIMDHCLKCIASETSIFGISVFFYYISFINELFV